MGLLQTGMPPYKLSGVYDNIEEGQINTKELVLVAPSIYAPRSAWDDGTYRGRPLPETAELVMRCVGGGPFVIFAKGSLYNFASGRFDASQGHHARVSAEQFRESIARLAEAS